MGGKGRKGRRENKREEGGSERWRGKEREGEGEGGEVEMGRDSIEDGKEGKKWKDGEEESE